MRERAYNWWGQAPIKVASGLGWVAGVASAFRPDWTQNLLGSDVSAETVQSVGTLLLAGASIYFAVLWMLKPSGRGHTPGGGTVINVSGDFHSYQELPEKMKIDQVEAPPSRATIEIDNATHEHSATSPTITGSLDAEIGDVTLRATGITGLSGLYVGNVVVAAGLLRSDRRLEIAIVGFNGSGEVISIAEISGRIRASTGNIRDAVKLPQLLVKGPLNAEPGVEFVFQLRQEVSEEQSEEYLNALDEGQTIALDLRELNIAMRSVANPNKAARLPLWDGVHLRRRDDVVSNRTHILSPPLLVNENKFFSPTVTQSPPRNDDEQA